MTTWTIKYETMRGQVREAKIKAETNHEAIVSLCKQIKVGNILAVSDCYRVQWV
jgi:hypothetical protein